MNAPDPAAPEQRLQQALQLYRAGQHEAAAALCRPILESRPADARAPYLLGTIALERGAHAEAEALLARSVQLAPEWPEAHHNLAAARLALGRAEEALQGDAQALRLRPGFVDAWIGHGLAAWRLGRPRDALGALREAYQRDPASWQAFFHTGVVLQEIGMPTEACRAYDRVVQLKPDAADAWTNRGIVLRNLGRLQDAVDSLARATQVQPASLAAWQARAHLLWELRSLDAASECLVAAERLAPGDARTRMLLSEVALSGGNWHAGWQFAEARWDAGLRGAPASTAPRWTGDEAIADRTVLVDGEGGFGDVVMFARFVPALVQRGAQVILRVAAPLVPLLATLDPAVDVIADDAEMPAHATWVPLMSLPLVLRCDGPAQLPVAPYLRADAARVARWQQHLGERTRPRIGLAWSGKAHRDIDANPLRNRSLPLASVQPLFDLPLDFHVVQTEIAEADLAALRGRPNVHLHRAELHDFAETAALLASLDATLTVDTSIAHVAGALGGRLAVWLPVATDFRWDGADGRTPWYPHAQLLRQAKAADWSEPVARARAFLTGG